MKRILGIVAVLVLSHCVFAQELTDAQKAAADAASAIDKVGVPASQPKPVYWANSFAIDLGLTQTAFANWAAGGYNNVALNAAADFKANYARDLIIWNNRLQLDYGFLWSADKIDLIQKSTDRIYLQSNFGYKTSEKSKWNYSAAFDFKTQFSNSFDNYKKGDDGKWTGDLKSGFMSPAYINLSVGMEWVPNTWFTLNLSPLSGGLTVVTNENLRSTYGLHLKDQYAQEPSPAGYMYNSVLAQLGAQIKADVHLKINDNFSYETQLVLFTDYLDHPFVHNRVNWDNSIAWTVVKFFKIKLDTWLIYDPLVTINGAKSRVQFKEFLSINFTYSISNKKDK